MRLPRALADRLVRAAAGSTASLARTRSVPGPLWAGVTAGPTGARGWLPGSACTVRRPMSTSPENSSPLGPDDVKRKKFYFKKSEAGGRFEWLLDMLGYNTKEAKQVRSAAALYVLARDQSSQAEFVEHFGLEKSFENRFYLECLHIWMILVRLRKEGALGKATQQELFENFHSDLTTQMHSLGVETIQLSARARELQNVFYGAAVSYDYSLGVADALLASALYRNIYGCNGRALHVEKLVRYVRREVHIINEMDASRFLEGAWTFGNPLNV